MSYTRVIADLRSLVTVVQTRQLPFLAAAIAYYAFLSIIPLLIVSITLSAAVAGEAVADEIVNTFNSLLTPATATLIEETLVTGSGAGGVTAVGLLVLLWSSLRVFRGLDVAFGQIYGQSSQKGIPYQVRDALLVLVGIALAVGATVVLTALLSLVELPFAGFVGTIGLTTSFRGRISRSGRRCRVRSSPDWGGRFSVPDSGCTPPTPARSSCTACSAACCCCSFGSTSVG